VDIEIGSHLDPFLGCLKDLGLSTVHPANANKNDRAGVFRDFFREPDFSLTASGPSTMMDGIPKKGSPLAVTSTVDASLAFHLRIGSCRIRQPRSGLTVHAFANNKGDGA
jgi:hypothetical protein